MPIDKEILKILAREEYKEEFEKLEKERQQIHLETKKLKEECEKRLILLETEKLKEKCKRFEEKKKKMKEQLVRLNNLPDLNSPQAKEIINSLILISEIPI